MSVETVGLDHLRARVDVTGELDMSTSAPLWAVLQSHLAVGRRFLRLDLSDVGFLDAAALSGIVGAHHDSLAQRGTLVLTGVHRRIARLLRLTGLDDVLLIGDTTHGDIDLAPISGGVEQPQPTLWPARPVPWTPLAAAHRSRPASPDR
jgi:anti-sigma B factor antagonist